MNKNCVEPLVLGNESVDETMLQTNTDIAFCLDENQAFQNIEISTDKMGLENVNKEFAELQEKEASGRQCPVCFKSLKRKEYFIHIRQSHIESYPHHCEFCKFICQDLNQLRHHIQKKHKEKDINSSSFINHNSIKNNIENDILSDDDSDLIENTKKRGGTLARDCYICPLCFRKLKTLPNLKKHIMQHSNKRLECSACKFKSIFKGQMSSHYYQEHPNKEIQWKEIFLDIGGSNNLVEDVEPYLLQVKDKYGFRKPNKNSNLLRQYQCPYCDYISNFNSSYNRHLRIHAGKKDFKCGYCNFHAREAYVIHKHSKKLHINQEVKIEKDIGYNVPYRYSKQSKIKSTTKSETISKVVNGLGSCTSSIYSNDTINGKIENFISDIGPVSHPVITKACNVIDSSIISRENKMLVYGIEKTWDHSYYEKSREIKNCNLYGRLERESKEMDIVLLNKEREYLMNTSLDKNDGNSLCNEENKIKRRFESDKTSINPKSQLFQEYKNIKNLQEYSIYDSKSSQEFETDTRSLTIKKTPLINGKLVASQDINIFDKILTKDVDVSGLSDNIKVFINTKQIVQPLNDGISELPNIVLCDDNNVESKEETVFILTVDQGEVSDSKHKVEIPIKIGDRIRACKTYSDVKRRECPEMSKLEMSFATSEFENFKNSDVCIKVKDFDVHNHEQENKVFNKSKLSLKLNNVPCASERITQDIGLDYQNKEYFNPDKIRSMMKIVENGRLECIICGVTTTRRAFYKHAKKHFNIKPFQCGHCDYRSIEKSMIRSHNSRCHSGSHCIIIKHSPKNASKLSQDSELFKPKNDDSSDSPSLESNLSTDNVDDIMKLNFEENLDTGSTNISNKSISSSNQLRLFKCPACQKELRFHHPTVRRHLYIHYNYKPFKCSLCHFTASTVGEIRGHHVTHRTTEEARIESSGAVMNPNLEMLLEDIFGYGPQWAKSRGRVS